MIVILCTITSSLTPMESPIKHIKRTFKRANTRNAASKKKREKQETSTLTPSTFFKKKLIFSSQCCQYNIPQEIYRYIQQLLYASENEKLLNSGTFGTNWQAYEFNLLDYHRLNQKQFEIMKHFLTTTPNQLPSKKSYTLFIETMPNSIKTCIANDFPKGIYVYRTTAAQADLGFYMLAATPKNEYVGLTLMPIFPKQTKKKIKKNNNQTIVSKLLL